MNILYLVLLVIGASVYAKQIEVVAVGEFHSLVPKEKMNETDFYTVKNHAISDAKEKAVEEAGTIIYSSINQYSNSKGKNYSEFASRATSAAYLRSKTVKTWWDNNNTYHVKIKATVELEDIKDIIEINKTRDAKLMRLEKQIRDNAKNARSLDRDIDKIRSLMISEGDSAYLMDKALYDKLIHLTEKRDTYNKAFKKNVAALRHIYKVKDFSELLKKNREAFAFWKRQFDLYFFPKYILRTEIYEKNLNIGEKDGKALIGFTINISQDITTSYKYDKHFQGFIDSDRETPHRPFTDRYSDLLYSPNPYKDMVKEWLDKERVGYIKIIIGKHEYLSEPIAFAGKRWQYDGHLLYHILNTQNGIMQRRILIDDIPTDELENIEHISFELIFVNPKKYAASHDVKSVTKRGVIKGFVEYPEW